ncbi:MAG: thiamine phosphate synthase [Candidatus Omnitrophica bacterium]|nr:thiamine phosphate synthase [Candidatus Omnitrophota bacterium]
MLKESSLYFVTSEEYSAGRGSAHVTREATAGGADIVQMREKGKTREELLALGGELGTLCRKSGVIFIVNDDPYLAGELGADGVHLGQEDIKKYPAGECRDILGEGRIIGLSTHSPAEFARANDMDLDYIAYGPVFPTKTKNYHIGTGDIEQIVTSARKPVFFIGGINLSNIEVLLALGCRNFAMIREIAEAPDVLTKTREIKARILRRENLGDM